MSGIEGLLIGRVLGGRYRIEEVIGRGGMGAVYRTLDERLGRLVALKVITVAGSGDAESRERLRARFFREARSAAALPHHPNVVPVYDYGSDEALGLDYLVMELLRGSDLATRLARSGPPPLAPSLKILLEAARGIAVGHRQGLIHRDIKPGNIFLTEPHANEVQVRVVDFGIAKLADDDDTLGQLTQDGRVPHSPAYASPEQLRGLSHLTVASDVFSLGAVGYQLLTGERPFTESDRNKMSLGMSVEARSLRETNPAIPSSVDAVIRRALAVDPARRFRDADEMASELERAMRTMADQPLEPYLAGSAIVTAADAPQTTPPFVAPEDDEDRTQLVFDDDDRTLLAPPPPQPVANPVVVPAPKGRGKQPLPPVSPPLPAARKKRRGFGGFLVWGFVFVTLAVAAMWMFNGLADSGRLTMPDGYDRAADEPELVVEEPQDEVVEEEPEETPEDQAFASNADGLRFFSQERFDDAHTAFARAVELDPEVPQYRRNLGLALNALGDLIEADRAFAAVIEMDPALAIAYRNRAATQLALGDTAAAIESLEEYVERESSPVSRRIAADELEALRTAREAPGGPPLLGDAVNPPAGSTPAPVPPTQRQTPAPTSPGDG